MLVQTRWCFIFYETQVCCHHWGGLILSTKYRHFNASLLVRKRFRAFPVHLILPSPSFSSPCLFFFFSTLKDEIVSQTGSLNIFNMTMPSSHLSLSHTHFLLSILWVFLFPSSPFYNFFHPFSQEVGAPDRCWSVWSGPVSHGAGPPATPQWTHYVSACLHRTRTPWEPGRKWGGTNE